MIFVVKSKSLQIVWWKHLFFLFQSKMKTTVCFVSYIFFPFFSKLLLSETTEAKQGQKKNPTKTTVVHLYMECKNRVN